MTRFHRYLATGSVNAVGPVNAVDPVEAASPVIAAIDEPEEIKVDANAAAEGEASLQLEIERLTTIIENAIGTVI